MKRAYTAGGNDWHHPTPEGAMTWLYRAATNDADRLRMDAHSLCTLWFTSPVTHSNTLSTSTGRDLRWEGRNLTWDEVASALLGLAEVSELYSLLHHYKTSYGRYPEAYVTETDCGLKATTKAGEQTPFRNIIDLAQVTCPKCLRLNRRRKR